MMAWIFQFSFFNAIIIASLHCICLILLSTCIRKEIIISWGEQIFYADCTTKNMQRLSLRMSSNPIEIGIEVSMVGWGDQIKEITMKS
jgi:hypothetical protein